MSRPDSISAAQATDAIAHDTIDLALTLGTMSAAQVAAIADALSQCFLRGVAHGGQIALNAIDESLGQLPRPTVN
jgi:hypothetical protein